MYWARLPNALFLTTDSGYKSKYIKPQNWLFGGKVELSFTDTKQDKSSCANPFAFSTEKHDKNVHLLYPGIANVRAFDNYSVYKSTRII